jgi:hypothetical protein
MRLSSKVTLEQYMGMAVLWRLAPAATSEREHLRNWIFGGLCDENTRTRRQGQIFSNMLPKKT